MPHVNISVRENGGTQTIAKVLLGMMELLLAVKGVLLESKPNASESCDPNDLVRRAKELLLAVRSSPKRTEAAVSMDSRASA
ncbi:hypothetical protein N7532_007007 [Penicillium argentinense]|uniref:Uncharacterized protein n=1 Tax=Penicillium argentinense TaxID=1131581 RepID=A0A9W9KBU4_9EURO|nr:uncharacterized protein N7532_007007 [Penicillium argentinense]KAJ5100006.1 hypothetical protein N7532_007007 [Penicillium argentinense]